MTGFSIFIVSVFFALIFSCALFCNIFKNQQKMNLAAAEFIFSLLSSDDLVFKNHSLHVYYIVKLFYKYLPFKYKAQLSFQKLAYSALLHDIGKKAIPKEILYKPGKLTKTEQEIVKAHTKIGSEMIKQFESLKFMDNVILYHHERIDGLESQFADLRASKISLDSKIIAIADAYSAIVLENSFKPSRTYSDAILSLKISAGSQFDKELVEIFCSIPPIKLKDCELKLEQQDSLKNVALPNE